MIFLLNFVSLTDLYSLLLMSVNNIIFIQFLKLETVKSFLTPPFSGILTSFSLNYFQFCFRNDTQIKLSKVYMNLTVLG